MSLTIHGAPPCTKRVRRSKIKEQDTGTQADSNKKRRNERIINMELIAGDSADPRLPHIIYFIRVKWTARRR